MPGKVKIDEHFIGQVRDQLMTIRNQISGVQSGGNPADPGTPKRGFPLKDFALRPSGDAFLPGASLKTRTAAVASQVDEKMKKFDSKLAAHAQALNRVMALGDNVELENTSLADWIKAGGNQSNGM